MQLIRGTTPTINMNVKSELDLTLVKNIWVYVSQQNKVKIDKGIDDVTSPLRKNNLYYDGDKNKNKSVKDSIKSGIRDIKYIHKSLNEIENPTKVGYVSVVDRTEDYDPNDYLSRPSDDDSDKIIQMEKNR